VYEEIQQEIGDVSEIKFRRPWRWIVLLRTRLLTRNLVNFIIWIWL
jgi:hypothetical protein